MRGDGPWTEMNDRNTADLRREIAEKFQYATDTHGLSALHYGEAAWKLWTDALLYSLERDSFLEWLEELPAWDGASRLSHWLADVFEADEGPLTEWASRFIFEGAVARAFEPGIKLDEMPVLIGPQGIGKSSALRLALPPDHPGWFADGLNLAAFPKERAEALQGRVIVEVAEMAGSTRAELESLKSFLSRTDDGSVRLAYRRNPETLLRRCIIVGTTNDPNPLPNDPSGNRRFVPVVLIGGDVVNLIAYMGSNREQLWSEAVSLFMDEIHPRLPEDLKPAQAEATERARRRDELLEDAVDRWLLTSPVSFTIAEAAMGCGLVDPDRTVRLSMRDQRRIGSALTNAGCVKQRIRNEGERVTMWAKR